MKKILVVSICLLILLTAGCTGSKKSDFTPESPEGVVEAYYTALQNGKPAEAYEYLKAPWVIGKEDFVREKSSSGVSFKEFSVGKGEISGSTATVPVKFKTGVSSMPELTLTITLEKGDAWKITSLGMGNASPTAPHSAVGSSDNSGGYDPSLVNPNGPGGLVPANK